jgi:hypothetical protein
VLVAVKRVNELTMNDTQVELNVTNFWQLNRAKGIIECGSSICEHSSRITSGNVLPSKMGKPDAAHVTPGKCMHLLSH